MSTQRGFKKTPDKEISFQIEALEVSLLTSLIEQVILLLTPQNSKENNDPLAKMVGIDSTAKTPDDEVLLRLLPDAYQSDKQASAEFRRFTERSLRELKVKRANFVLENLPEPEQIISIKPKDFETWLTVLNDLRLALGVRAGITENNEEEISEDLEIDHARDIYSWLTWLQSNLLEEMSS
ncbi:MAG: DUF2017 domain-containing protein [Candidatus Nanopelagicales bacterium]|nr:DUF2017 domain-containing protein [Actinomycetota bacterium]MDA3026465.1 DUF2017 domain-containing protein [Actinomycetota bacterium]MDP5107679.1 DUF2017 domain-containing protein [Candidatus Nanopelagicales bacterium]